ncbi:MAG: carbohydrate ABC transporter substrate-binding protein [Clostridia bacterium]|nr:carbohydrate ABC transporter substrate-binding protein [Clostridia bacterium]
MKRIVSVLFALVMLLATVGCNSAPATAPNTTPATTAPATVPATTAPEVTLPTFGGADLLLGDVAGWFTAASLEGSNTLVKLYNILADIEAELDVHISTFPVSTDVFSQAQPVLMSGEKYADAVHDYVWTMGDFWMANLLTPVSDLPYVDLTAEWWLDGAMEVTTLNGKTYGVAGDIYPAVEAAYYLFFNKNMAEDLGLPDLYQLVKDGKWTLAEFEKCIKAATRDNGDNVWTMEDTYGFCGPDGTIDQGFFVAAGGSFFENQEDGSVRISVNDADNVALIDKLTAILRDGGYRYNYSGGEDWIWTVQSGFASDKFLFCAHSAMATKWYWPDMSSDFGLIPMSKADENQTEYYSYADHNVFTLYVPIHANKEMAGAFLQTLGKRGHEELMPIFWEDYEMNLLRDEESFENFKMLSSQLRFHHLTTMLGVPNNGLYAGTLSAFINTMATPGSSFSSFYEAGIEVTRITMEELSAYFE